jgi:hypothetical protein
MPLGLADLGLQPAEGHEVGTVPPEQGVGEGMGPHGGPLVVDLLLAEGLAVTVDLLDGGQQPRPVGVVGARRGRPAQRHHQRRAAIS